MESNNLEFSKPSRAEVNYMDLISIKNIFQAWNEFKMGKRKKADVMLFERFLEENLFTLHLSLKNKTYSHGNYQSLQSYLGYLSHANSYKLTQNLKNQIWLWKN